MRLGENKGTVAQKRRRGKRSTQKKGRIGKAILSSLLIMCVVLGSGVGTAALAGDSAQTGDVSKSIVLSPTVYVMQNDIWTDSGYEDITAYPWDGALGSQKVAVAWRATDATLSLGEGVSFTFDLPAVVQEKLLIQEQQDTLAITLRDREGNEIGFAEPLDGEHVRAVFTGSTAGLSALDTREDPASSEEQGVSGGEEVVSDSSGQGGPDPAEQALPDSGSLASEGYIVFDFEQQERANGAAQNLQPMSPLAGSRAPRSGPASPTGSAHDAPQYGQLSLVKFVQVANGQLGGTALDSSGAVWAWGYNGEGALGMGNLPSGVSYYGGMKRIPYFAENGITIVEIGACYQTRYALSSSGEVYAWGEGANGGLGNGGTANSNTPIKVAGLTNVAHIYARSGFDLNPGCFALKADGTLWGWGANSGPANVGVYGLPSGNLLTPTQIPLDAEFSNGTRTIVKVAPGRTTTFILDSLGDLWGTGNDTYGQQGNGPGNQSKTVFTKMDRTLTGMAGVIDIDINYSALQCISERVVALDANRDVWEWGSTFGDGGYANSRIDKQTPTKIGLDPAEVAAIGYTPIPQVVSASEMVGYFIDQHGRPWAWGTGYYFGLGREGNYGSTGGSNTQRIHSTAAAQYPKVIGDGDTQYVASDPNRPVYLGGTGLASGRGGYGFNDLHPTIYDEKYMLKDANGVVLDEQGRTLKYATGTTVDGVSGLTTGRYYLSSGGAGTANRILSPATTSTPAINPEDKLWIDLALQPTPFVMQMDMTLSAYCYLDASGNLFKWGNDGSGSVAWGWDYDPRYDQNGSLSNGLYDRYTYEVMYMRGAPTIDNLNLSASLDKKVYTNTDGTVDNPVTVSVHMPATAHNQALDAGVYSDLTDLKYVLIPYDTNDPNFSLSTGSLSEADFMALYNDAPAELKGDLLDTPVHSGAQAQDWTDTINVAQNGRLIIYAANQRYAGSPEAQEYLNEDPIFTSVIVDNIYTTVAVKHSGVGENPSSGERETVYEATNANGSVFKDLTTATGNDDSAVIAKPEYANLFGLPLDANEEVIGATKDPVSGEITIGEQPRFGYDVVQIASFEAGLPGVNYPDASVLNYWQWQEYLGAGGTPPLQPKTASLTMNDFEYADTATYPNGYLHLFFYEPNDNWTKVSGTKTWDDTSNQYGLRPSSIFLTLKQYARDPLTGVKGSWIKDVKTIEVTSSAFPGSSNNAWAFDFGASFKTYEYAYEVVESAEQTTITPLPLYRTETTYENVREVLGDPSSSWVLKTSITNFFDLKPVLFIKADAEHVAITSDTAEFTLTNSVAGESVLNASGVAVASISLATSSADGTVLMPLQKPGTYVLTETKAPAGYNLLRLPVTVTVHADGTVTASHGSIDMGAGETLTTEQAAQYAALYMIINRIAAELPKAGGMGTLAILAISTFFMFGAAVLLRKRKKKHTVPDA